MFRFVIYQNVVLSFTRVKQKLTTQIVTSDGRKIATGNGSHN